MPNLTDSPEKVVEMTKSKNDPMSQQTAEPNQLQFPTSDGTDIISQSIGYFRLSAAAKLLRCAPEILLQMGAVGHAEIMAPVVAGGLFEWLKGMAGIAFPGINGPFQREFGPADRVILTREDLAQIEEIGWVIPQSFIARSQAEEFIKNALMTRLITSLNKIESKATESNALNFYAAMSMTTNEVSDPKPNDWICSSFLINPSSVEKVVANGNLIQPEALEPNSKSSWMKVAAFAHPWRAVSAPGKDAEKTTINYLYISKTELQRLKKRLLQGDVASESEFSHEQAEIECPNREINSINDEKTQDERQSAPQIGQQVETLCSSMGVFSKNANINKLNRRSTDLTAPIAAARGIALDRNDTECVWTTLVSLARSAKRPPPLTGYDENKMCVQYESRRTGKVEDLTRKKFGRIMTSLRAP